MKDHIDFDNRIPYRIQLSGMIKEKLRQGAWQPGEQIPSHREPCALYGISRRVVCQTLRGLELGGVVSRRRVELFRVRDAGRKVTPRNGGAAIRSLCIE